MLQPLSEHNIVNCTDERTREFGTALIDFALWDTQRMHGNVDEALKKERYQWPSYILNLISRPRDWSAWRSIAEKRALKERWSKRKAYLRLLQEEYLTTSEAEEQVDESSDESLDAEPELTDTAPEEVPNDEHVRNMVLPASGN
jgi:hypothetical protein